MILRIEVVAFHFTRHEMLMETPPNLKTHVIAIQWFQWNLIRDPKFITLFCKLLFQIIILFTFVWLIVEVLEITGEGRNKIWGNYYSVL